MLLQLIHDIVRDEVSLLFAEPLSKSPHKLARSHQREGDRKPEHVATGLHPRIENRSGT